MLDPILALAGRSEYVFMTVYPVKETFVRKMLVQRAIMCLCWIALIDAVLCCLFILVPGKRL